MFATFWLKNIRVGTAQAEETLHDHTKLCCSHEMNLNVMIFFYLLIMQTIEELVTEVIVIVWLVTLCNTQISEGFAIHDCVIEKI